MQQCSNNLHPTLPATAPMGKKVEGERQKVPDANSLTPKRRQFPHGFSMFLLQYKSGLYFRQILVIVISPTQQQQESSRSAETCRQGGQDKIKVRDSSSGLSWKKNRPQNPSTAPCGSALSNIHQRQCCMLQRHHPRCNFVHERKSESHAAMQYTMVIIILELFHLSIQLL